MKTKLIAVTTLMLAAVVPNARASCCDKPDCPVMKRVANNDQTGALMEPVKSVLDNYLKIQLGLANDSIDGVASNASAIASAVRGDSMKMLSPEIAAQADALANAKDVAAAREAFKPLSKSLIAYLNANNGTNAYLEVYCPMAKASWLQKGEKIDNPYLGSSMRSCGQIQKAKQKSS